MKPSLAPVCLGLLLPAMHGMAQSTAATVNVSTAQPTPLNANFSGFNYEGNVPYEPFDPLFAAQAAKLIPGWVRYPGGITSQAFNWQTGSNVQGLLSAAWVNEFSSSNEYANLQQALGWVFGKGGQQFLDVGNLANSLGAQIIVCVNGFTDTPQSAGQMAAYALANHIPVAVWELSNEAYLFVPSFFQSGADYAAKMKPYRDAIKAADPNAVVALFFSDPALNDLKWDKSLVSYTPQYWDAITYHHYGAESTGAFSQWMADQAAVLYSQSSAYLAGTVMPLNPPEMKYVISEFNSTGDALGNNPSLTNGTVWGGIYDVEYTLRLSTIASLLHMGSHSLVATYDVDANDRHFPDVEAAYQAGTPINTTTLTFGYFLGAQGEAIAVMNGVLENATQVETTTVTGGATIPATGLGQIPALYAQGYANAAGAQSIVITNKSAVEHTVTLQVNGSPVSGSLPMQYVSASDPSTLNTSSTDTPVTIQKAVASNPITVLPYSVTHVDVNTAAITIQTSPAGLQFSVDGGASQTAPQTFNLASGAHSIAVASTQAGRAGTQYVFVSWSDGGGASHAITVGGASAVYTATFQTQYQLTISASPAADGTVTPTSGGFYNAGTSVAITATAGSGFQFSNWTGAVASSTSASTTVTMSAPETAAANFTAATTTSGLAFYPVTPCRVADTRNATGPFGGPILSAGSTRSFAIPSSTCGIPSSAQAYSLNITVVPPAALGYLTAWPTGETQPYVSTLNSSNGAIIANAAIVPAGTGGSISIYVSDATHVIIDINGYFAAPSGSTALAFYPVTPCRVADTRNANGPFGGPSLAAGATRNFTAPQSACNIPATAQAYSLNMTVVPPGALEYLSTWPAGQSQPVVSTLNALQGQIAANAAIVPAGTNGAISVYVSDASNVIIDINGYFAPPGETGALYFYPVTPCRIADTRNATGTFGGPSLPADATRTFPIPSSSCGLPSTARAYSLNMTVAPPGSLLYLSTWPAGQTQPVVSTLNDLQGQIVANAAIVPAGGAGGISVYISDATNLIIDANGYFAQ